MSQKLHVRISGVKRMYISGVKRMYNTCTFIHFSVFEFHRVYVRILFRRTCYRSPRFRNENCLVSKQNNQIIHAFVHLGETDEEIATSCRAFSALRSCWSPLTHHVHFKFLPWTRFLIHQVLLYCFNSVIGHGFPKTVRTKHEYATLMYR